MWDQDHLLIAIIFYVAVSCRAARRAAAGVRGPSAWGAIVGALREERSVAAADVPPPLAASTGARARRTFERGRRGVGGQTRNVPADARYLRLWFIGMFE